MVMMGRWSDDSACLVVHDVPLYSDTVVISGEDVCCTVVFFPTLIGVSVLSVIWSELLMTSAIYCVRVPESGVCVHISGEELV